ncbi:MAG TPA: hypothetical protein PK926_09205 [Spirochaetota bacterium]|nr:hypothetical protein [Spirochaetota bacterium]HPI89773.1 hypothetical protein [Spirochaetota bacterium]HPR47602.1 hypothetical protein [Spirochaetota bacterium]
MIHTAVHALVISLFLLTNGSVDTYEYDNDLRDSYSELRSIKNVNGKFYAYIVLLFNENPHFVNLIQKDSIPLRLMSQEGFHIKEYRQYLKTITDRNLRVLAEEILNIYLEPLQVADARLREIEQILVDKNIILQFSRERFAGAEKISLDYSIFGKRALISIKHPILKINEKIYNIQPYIYYDEFSTSNSTFYYNMIYINPVEVENDYLIAKKIINGENVNSYFFVGSRITGDIRYCLLKAFPDKQNIRNEIWKMFVIHELTHKVLNNTYNNYDQITGEELSLCSTIYLNPYLGLSVMYSYLNYNSINPHRIAVINLIRFYSEQTGKKEIIARPGLIKNLKTSEIKNLARDYFNSKLQGLEP